MTHFLDTKPFDWSRPGAQALLDLLSSAYYTVDRVIGVLQNSGVPPGQVALQGAVVGVWRSAIEVASGMLRLREMLETVLADPTTTAFHTRLEELLQTRPVVSSSADLEAAAGAGGPGEPPWHEAEDQVGLEKLLGAKSTLLDVSFLAGGLRVAPSVTRLRCEFSLHTYHGTGFRIGDDLILTNHHVLHDWEAGREVAKKVDLWFDYEVDDHGKNKPVKLYRGDVASIVGDGAQDWAVIRTPAPLPGDYPILPLGGSKPVEPEARVYIIQHPNGGQKQIGMHNNLVSHADDEVIRYLTDTLPGSSGSPVFNDWWEVVALHHRWVRVPGDGTARPAFRNQGRNILKVREGIEAAGIALPEGG